MLNTMDLLENLSQANRTNKKCISQKKWKASENRILKVMMQMNQWIIYKAIHWLELSKQMLHP